MVRRKTTARFTWTGAVTPLSYTTGGNTYPYETQDDAIVRGSDSRYDSFTTPINTLLTFTATTETPAGVVPIEYRWDFGDGITKIDYGPVVTHIYTTVTPQTEVKLFVTDSAGNTASSHQVLNLRAASRIFLQPSIRVVTV